MRPPPSTVRDRDSWRDAAELDDSGEDLTQWEIDFIESLMSQLLEGHYLTEKQKQKLWSIADDRIRS